jgi:hypothetical protein
MIDKNKGAFFKHRGFGYFSFVVPRLIYGVFQDSTQKRLTSRAARRCSQFQWIFFLIGLIDSQIAVKI